jgi:uncharacterized protein (DUF1330 family)
MVEASPRQLRYRVAPARQGDACATPEAAQHHRNTLHCCGPWRLVGAALVAAAGGHFITRGEKTVALHGPAPKRFAITQFDSLEQAQAYRSSAAYKEIIPIRDKSSKFHSFIVEGSVNAVVGK